MGLLSRGIGTGSASQGRFDNVIACTYIKAPSSANPSLRGTKQSHH